ncbi:MAG TPA: hypothetical protein VFS08_03750 [Gemmatimonadaceae bacterium]|nr:hypothetical protein [Gemmatimonadaceae bacterium]
MSSPTPPDRDEPRPPVPATPPSVSTAGLDRAAVERVLARAVELQASTPDRTGLLSEAQILELGQEVGLAPEALRQALAEERTRTAAPVEAGLAARLFGPAHASATRTVRGTPEQTLRQLDQWMLRDECLQPKRRFPDRITWEARRDIWGSLRRSFNLGGREYALARAREVGAPVVPVDDELGLVHLAADLSSARTGRLRAGGAAAAVGLASTATMAALASMFVVPAALPVVIALAAVPTLAGVGGGYAVARGHGALVARTQVALEQLLDRLEHAWGTPAPFPALGRFW